jgi:penicillin-binding protein 2
LASSGARAGRNGSGRFLPPDPRVETPYRFTPQLALRIAIVGAVALAAFGVLFFRLWALQVLSGPQYLRAALDNQVRSVRIDAPRGEILDRNGRALVTNVPGMAVELHPADLPDTWAARLAELRRLSKVVHVPVREMLRGIKERGSDPVTPVIVREDVKRTAPIAYLQERADDFPGVSVESTYVRGYPYGRTAAQLLGYVAEISPAQLKALQSKGYAAGDQIGETGVESTYDSYLRGRAGLAQLRVDARGRPRSPLVTERQPEAGESIRLTLDVPLQQAAQDAIRFGMSKAFENDQWEADGGAIVAMDPRDGSILAMASYPDYNPRVYSGHVTTKRLAAAGLTPSSAERDNFPSLDRATSGLYPAGSTFKPVTALAALETHILPSTSTELHCTGSYSVPSEFAGGKPQVFHNVDPYTDQWMTLPTALAASCDTWFYQLGDQFYKAPPSAGHPLQDWAAKFGFGQKTGVDVGPENSGLLPTPAWRRHAFTPKTDPHNWQIDRYWKPGDSIQLAIGQKDLLVTPLQMARFYSLIANGGKLVRPHVVQDVVQGGGGRAEPRPIHRFTAAAPKPVGLDPTYLAAVQDGLYQATHASYGTAYGVFNTFPIQVAGKTGTAQKDPSNDQLDQSWWCGYGPVSSAEPPEIVVCAIIENGGFGADAAAPAALQVFKQYFKKQLEVTPATPGPTG